MSVRRPLWIVLLYALCTVAAAQPTTEDWVEIKRVIAAQRDALVRGEKDEAFSYATPGIRQRYGDAETFIRMVRQSYAALLDARYVEFLDGAVIGGDVVQPLRLVLADGTVLVAIYGMLREPDGRWRINACIIAPSTVRSA